MSNNNLTKKILIGLITGMVLGIFIYYLGKANFVKNNQIYLYGYKIVIDNIAYVGGKVFVASLKLMVVPLVFVSLVCGVISIGNGERVGVISLKTLTLYIFTTFIAISSAILFAGIFNPGSNSEEVVKQVFEVSDPPPIKEVFVNLVPSNVIQAMSEGNMLQVIVFAVIFGLAISSIKKKAHSVVSFFEQLDQVLMRLVTILMSIAPYGVFFLVLTIFSETGPDNIGAMAGYFGTVVFVLLLHVGVVYPILLLMLGKISPIPLYKKIQRLWLFSFSTASSNASIPVTMDIVENKLGVRNEVASFSIPLGATMNMDGTAIMQGVATVFISQFYGIEIGLVGYLTVILTATLASVGAAGVPGVGLITLSLVLQQVGLPVEGIALIIGVDRLLDMLRTAVNVTGDAAVSVIVSRSENMLDKDKYLA